VEPHCICGENFLEDDSARLKGGRYMLQVDFFSGTEAGCSV